MNLNFRNRTRATISGKWAPIFQSERTQGLLCETISQERCTGSARSGGEAHLFGRRDGSLKRKVALVWSGHKLETEKREKRSGGKKALRVIYCGLFLGSITTACLISRLTEMLIDLMYILSTRRNILLRDYS